MLDKRNVFVYIILELKYNFKLFLKSINYTCDKKLNFLHFNLKPKGFHITAFER